MTGTADFSTVTDALILGHQSPFHIVRLLLLLTAPFPAVAAELKVTIEQVASGSGNLLVAVCTPETFLRRGCPLHGPGSGGQRRS